MIDILIKIWNFFWQHDQFFMMLIIAYITSIYLKSQKIREANSAYIANLYQSVLDTLIVYMIRSKTEDIDSLNKELFVTMQLLFTKLKYFGTLKVQRFLKERTQDGIIVPTNEMLCSLVDLLQEEMGCFPFAIKTRMRVGDTLNHANSWLQKKLRI